MQTEQNKANQHRVCFVWLHLVYSAPLMHVNFEEDLELRGIVPQEEWIRHQNWCSVVHQTIIFEPEKHHFETLNYHVITWNILWNYHIKKCNYPFRTSQWACFFSRMAAMLFCSFRPFRQQVFGWNIWRRELCHCFTLIMLLNYGWGSKQFGWGIECLLSVLFHHWNSVSHRGHQNYVTW